MFSEMGGAAIRLHGDAAAAATSNISHDRSRLKLRRRVRGAEQRRFKHAATLEACRSLK